MSKITVLDQATINQIAAGEVVERPASVVKELVENAIDAGANAVTVEIKEGGISFLRVTDNGSGIEKDDIKLAFLRHSTSKIRSAVDLLSVSSLGFRGEALSSIAAVAQVELLTKPKTALVGVRYVIEGGEEKAFEEAGCPSGTTFLVRNLFFNTPARRKFLKTPMTEGGYINELMERMALSRPDISFKYMNNGKVMLHTTGSGDLKDIIYHIFGRDIAAAVLPAEYPRDAQGVSIRGFLGKPLIARGNRGQENYFINGRYIKCAVIGKAIEDAYKSFMMGHKYPFTALHITVPAEFVDVNVHPSKMELRFADGEAMYRAIWRTVSDTLSGKNMIVPVSLSEKEERREEKERMAEQQKKAIPEPFESRRREMEAAAAQNKAEKPSPIRDNLYGLVREEMPGYGKKQEQGSQTGQNSPIGQSSQIGQGSPADIMGNDPLLSMSIKDFQPTMREAKKGTGSEQLSLPVDLLTEGGKKEFRIIGQLFATYWLIEMEDQLFIIDQHAAHEKVLFERTMKKLRAQEEIVTQTLLPPLVVSLTMREADCLDRHIELFRKLGFVIEEFGGLEYKITEVPADMVTVDGRELLMEALDTLLSEREFKDSDLLLEKVASMSCKAAVKGGQRMSEMEAKELIAAMFTLENPYHCPHGRPTTISMSKYELERKFKRVL